MAKNVQHQNMHAGADAASWAIRTLNDKRYNLNCITTRDI